MRTLSDDVVQPQLGPYPTSSLFGARNILIQRACPGRATKHVAAVYDSVSFAALIDAVQHRIWDIYTAGLEQRNPDAWAAAFDEGLIAPESTFTPAREVPGTKTYVGREAFLEFTRAWTDEFAELRMRLEEGIDAGDDRVVAVVHQTAIGKGSGAAVELRFWIIYTLEAGPLTDRRHYLDPADALKAVGLSDG